MKKIFVALLCSISFILISCASKNIPSEELPFELNIDEPSEETNLIQDNNLNDEIMETSDIETEAEQNIETLEASFESEDSNSNETDYEQLDDIEEPVVITLDPVEIPVSVIENNENEESSEPEQIEPSEIELPPVNSDENDVTDILETTTEDITSVLASDDAIDVSDIENIDSENDDDLLISVDNQDAIDITNDNIENSVDAEILSSELEIEEITPSRKVTLKKQEYVDIVYPGNGWIYMGITDNSKDLSYFGRKLGTSDTKFTLQARNAGTKIVHFYKNDALTNQYIDDYIEIEILPEKGSNKTHIEAPAYKQPIPKKAVKPKAENKSSSEDSDISNTSNNSESANKLEAEKQETASIKNQKDSESSEHSSNLEDTLSLPPRKDEISSPVTKENTDIPADSSTPEQDTSILLPDTSTLLIEAKLLYNEKEYKAALDKLEIFFEHATSKRDEALYLKGQILEAKSEFQNIKAALEAYNTLTRNYPASKFWDDANKRIIYLKRFYFGG